MGSGSVRPESGHPLADQAGNVRLHDYECSVKGAFDRIVPLCEVVWVDSLLHELGAARCRQARERRLSLTDCVSIETMRRRGLTEAIASDEHFAREGFSLPARS
jgi:predicted nucleic acid-binding protein